MGVCMQGNREIQTRSRRDPDEIQTRSRGIYLGAPKERTWAACTPISMRQSACTEGGHQRAHVGSVYAGDLASFSSRTGWKESPRCRSSCVMTYLGRSASERTCDAQHGLCIVSSHLIIGDAREAGQPRRAQRDTSPLAHPRPPPPHATPRRPASSRSVPCGAGRTGAGWHAPRSESLPADRGRASAGTARREGGSQHAMREAISIQ